MQLLVTENRPVVGDGRCRESQEEGVAKGQTLLFICGDSFMEIYTHISKHIELYTLTVHFLYVNYTSIKLFLKRMI